MKIVKEITTFETLSVRTSATSELKLLPVPKVLVNFKVENRYKGKKGEDFDANNWPWVMVSVAEDLMQYKNVSSGYTTVDMTGLHEFLIQQKKRPFGAKYYDEYSNSDLEHLKNIEIKFNTGQEIIMMIDADMISNGVNYTYSDITNDSHWVVYKGGLQLLDKNATMTTDLDRVEEVSFKIFTWGFNPLDGLNENGRPHQSALLKNGQGKITVKSFKSNFYGYIEAN